MEKIAVIVNSNLHWAPFYYRYEKMLLSSGTKYDLIIWNRENIEENVNCNLIQFKLPDKTNSGSLFKVFKFIKYAHFLKKTINKQKYDKLVFLGSYACIPAMISKFLKKNYKNKFWLDIRDLTYERYRFFFKMESIAIRSSFKTVISSEGFIKYLPKYNYGLIHNIDPTMDNVFSRFVHSVSKRIRISYIGNLSYWPWCKQLIDVLGNDERYILNFVGPNYEYICNYCTEQNISNVSFSGPFKREDTVLFYNETDIIYNLYGNDKLNVRVALSNKLYYGLRLKIPLLVNSDTFMADLVKKYGIGIIFENKPEFADILYNWYKGLDNKMCKFDDAWTRFKQEDETATSSFLNFIEKD